MNVPKIHSSHRTQALLDTYSTAAELCEDLPAIDDILSGALELKTAGNTSTRSLSRQTLFLILQRCPTIDVDSINKATHGRYAYRSLASYAAAARVASKAIEGLIRRAGPQATRLNIRQERARLDAPYHAELEALALL
jgi:hypothetical protein